MFKDKVTVITGGVQGIGKAIAEEFRAQGTSVCIIDKQPNDYFTGDIGDEQTLTAFVGKVIQDFDHVDYFIHNALQVGITAPFYLTKLLLPHFAPGVAVINIFSSRDRMSQPQAESYTAAKGGVLALTHAMVVSPGGEGDGKLYFPRLD